MFIQSQDKISRTGNNARESQRFSGSIIYTYVDSLKEASHLLFGNPLINFSFTGKEEIFYKELIRCFFHQVVAFTTRGSLLREIINKYKLKVKLSKLRVDKQV